MAAMYCNEFLNQLEPWMEGDPSSAAQAHLRNCPSCRTIAEDLASIQKTAQSWVGAEPEPPVRLWVSLKAQLEREGLIRHPQSSWREWLGGWTHAMPRPALAGAYLAVLIAVAIGFSGPIRNQFNQDRWLASAQNITTPFHSELDVLERDTISPAQNANAVVTASLHQNLAIVDNYIVLCEKNVSEEPQNQMARDYLYDAYQQKAELLAQMSERGDYIQ